MSYQGNIVQLALANGHFRKVLYTTERTQLVLMCVQPGDDIGFETHDLDQVLVFVAGQAETLLGGHQGAVGAGDVVVVPAGTAHNFINSGDEPLKLYTVYAPPEHAPGTIHRTKAEADAAEALHHGHGGHDASPAPAVVPASPAASVPQSAGVQRPAWTVGSLIGKGF